MCLSSWEEQGEEIGSWINRSLRLEQRSWGLVWGKGAPPISLRGFAYIIWQSKTTSLMRIWPCSIFQRKWHFGDAAWVKKGAPHIVEVGGGSYWFYVSFFKFQSLGHEYGRGSGVDHLHQLMTLVQGNDALLCESPFGPVCRGPDNLSKEETRDWGRRHIILGW